MKLRITAALGLLIVVVLAVLSGPGSAPARAISLTGYQSVGTVSPKGYTPNPETGIGGLCLSVLQFIPGSAVWLEPCNPASDAAQTWVVTYLYGTIDSWRLLSDTHLCVGGIPAYSDFATLYECSQPGPEDVAQGIAAYGGTGGGVNWFRNAKGLWLTGYNDEGRVTWTTGKRNLLQLLLRRGPNRGWIMNDGWTPITVD